MNPSPISPQNKIYQVCPSATIYFIIPIFTYFSNVFIIPPIIT